MSQKDPALEDASAPPPSESPPQSLVDGRGGQRSRRGKDGLSYKFQRLREKLRTAILEGAFSGKLPGERALARQFSVNAKTLSKALTDLAAEGLLDRSIGRGTYVKGAASGAGGKGGRWLVICNPQREKGRIMREIGSAHPQLTVVADVTSIRPSFLRHFDAVIDFGLDTPEAFLRDLVVRNVSVVAIQREADVYAVNAVGADCAHAAALMARDLFILGHDHLAVVETQPRSALGAAVRLLAARHAPQAVIQSTPAGQVAAAVQSGATAVLWDCPEAAGAGRGELEAKGKAGGVSMCAIGCCDDDVAVTGYYVHQRVVAESVVKLLEEGLAGGQRPITMWLATRYVDRQTVHPWRGQREGEAA